MFLTHICNLLYFHWRLIKMTMKSPRESFISPLSLYLQTLAHIVVALKCSVNEQRLNNTGNQGLKTLTLLQILPLSLLFTLSLRLTSFSHPQTDYCRNFSKDLPASDNLLPTSFSMTRPDSQAWIWSFPSPSSISQSFPPSIPNGILGYP